MYVYIFVAVFLLSSQCRSPSLNHFVPRFPNREEEDSTKFTVFENRPQQVSHYKLLTLICLIFWNISICRKNSKRYTKVHKGTQRYTRVHKGTQRYTKLHKGTQRYTKVHKGTQRYTKVHKGTQRYT